MITVSFPVSAVFLFFIWSGLWAAHRPDLEDLIPSGGFAVDLVLRPPLWLSSVCPRALQWACSVFSSESTADGRGEKYDSTVTLGWCPCAPLLSPSFLPCLSFLFGSISNSCPLWMGLWGVFLYACNTDKRSFISVYSKEDARGEMKMMQET